jgi:hypothetical protein
VLSIWLLLGEEEVVLIVLEEAVLGDYCLEIYLHNLKHIQFP